MIDPNGNIFAFQMVPYHVASRVFFSNYEKAIEAFDANIARMENLGVIRDPVLDEEISLETPVEREIDTFDVLSGKWHVVRRSIFEVYQESNGKWWKVAYDMQCVPDLAKKMNPSPEDS